MTTSVSALARRHVRAARWIGFLTVLLLASTGVAITSTAAVAATGQPARSCESLASLSLPNTTVVSAAENTTGTAVQPPFPPATGLPAFCDVQLTVTNPGFKDNINIEVSAAHEHLERSLPGCRRERFGRRGSALPLRWARRMESPG